MFEKLTISTEDSEVFLQLLLHWTVKDTKLLTEATVESTKLKKCMLQHNCTDSSSQRTLACSDYT